MELSDFKKHFVEEKIEKTNKIGAKAANHCNEKLPGKNEVIFIQKPSGECETKNSEFPQECLLECKLNQVLTLKRSKTSTGKTNNCVCLLKKQKK